MTHNMQPLHLDAEAAKASEFGQILVNSTFTFSLAVGLSIADTTVGTLVANLGFDKVVTPKPTFIGDTLTCSSEVVRSEEQTSELQSLMRISYAVFCLTKNKRGEQTTL